MSEPLPLTKERRRIACEEAHHLPYWGRMAIESYEAAVAALEATLDGYRAKGGAFFEDGFSYEAKMRAEAEARVQELEAEAATRKESIDRLHQTALDVMRERDEARAEVQRLTPPANAEHCDRCGRPAAKDAAQHYLHCEECDTGSLCQDCYDLHAMEGEILTLKREVARLTPLAEVAMELGQRIDEAGSPSMFCTVAAGEAGTITEAMRCVEAIRRLDDALAALAAAKGEDDAV